MSLFGSGGARSRALRRYLRRRSRTPAAQRPELDCRSFPQLFVRQAVVFTDTADFTVSTARYGILHFLMLFERLMPAAERAVRAARGRIVKVEGDSLLLSYPDAAAACRGVVALERALRSTNRGRPRNERLRFSYGIGYGDMIDIDIDLFGLEVNLASKIGEDLARPGEVLMTPAAAASLTPALLERVSAYRIITFDRTAIPVQRFRP